MHQLLRIYWCNERLDHLCSKTLYPTRNSSFTLHLKKIIKTLRADWIEAPVFLHGTITPTDRGTISR